MSDDITPVPTVLIEALRDDTTTFDRISIPAMDAIIACLPKPPPVFSDEVGSAFYGAMFASRLPDVGRRALTGLYESGWLTPTDDGSFIITPPKETVE